MNTIVCYDSRSQVHVRVAVYEQSVGRKVVGRSLVADATHQVPTHRASIGKLPCRLLHPLASDTWGAGPGRHIDCRKGYHGGLI